MTKLKITQRRSSNGANAQQRDTLRSLGLRRIDQSIEREDNPQLRGMVHRIRHLVDVEEEAGGAGRSRAAGGRESSSKARAGGPQGDS
jgi:large subunit ribosomal protein L30